MQSHPQAPPWWNSSVCAVSSTPRLRAFEVGPAPVAEETNPEMNIPIEDLNLTQRSYNCLKREGIHTIGELVAHTEQDLLDIRNFGMKSIDEVKEKLQSLGLALKASPLGNFDANNLEGGTFFSPEDE